MMGWLIGIIATVVLFNKISKTEKKVDILQHDLRVMRKKLRSLNTKSAAADSSGQSKQLTQSSNSSTVDNSVTDKQHSPQPSMVLESLRQKVESNANDFGSRPVAETSFQSNSNIENALYNWFKEDWLMKVGVLLILCGLGWFLSYAFTNGIIGPVGQISLGYLVGIVCLGYGHLRLDKYESQGSIVMVLGMAFVVATTFAARLVYEMFNPTVGVFISLAAISFVLFQSLVINRKSLATVGLIVAGIVPFWLQPGEPSEFGVLIYAIIISAIIFASLLYRNWLLLPILNAVGLVLYSLLIEVGGNTAAPGVWLLALFAILINALQIVWLHVNSEDNHVWGSVILYTNWELGVMWLTTTTITNQVISALVIALFFGVLAWWFFEHRNSKDLLLVYGFVALGSLSAAVLLLFSAEVSVVVITGLLSAWAMILARSGAVKWALRTSLLLVIPAFMAINAIYSKLKLAGYQADPAQFSIGVLALLAIPILIVITASRLRRKVSDSFAIIATLYVTAVVVFNALIYQLLDQFLVSDLTAQSWFTIFIALQYVLYLSVVRSAQKACSFVLYASSVLILTNILLIETGLVLVSVVSLLTIFALASSVCVLIVGPKLVALEHDIKVLQLPYYLSVLGGITLSLVSIWFTMIALYGSAIGVIISLVISALVAISLYFWAIKNHNKIYQWYGLVLLGVVVARLLLVEAWKLAVVERVLLFGLVGSVLIIGSIATKKFQDE